MSSGEVVKCLAIGSFKPHLHLSFLKPLLKLSLTLSSSWDGNYYKDLKTCIMGNNLGF
jgi:hypothetical protein